MCGTATTASASAIETDGDVDPEHPAPSPGVGDDATHERADEDRDGERGADDRQDARALAGSGDLADDRLRHQVQAGRADALPDARERELRDVLREAAEQRRDQEQDEARQEDQARRRRGRRACRAPAAAPCWRACTTTMTQLICCDGAELAGDRGERRRDDGVVERAEERDGEEGGDEEAEPPGRERHEGHPSDRAVDATGCAPETAATREDGPAGTPTSCRF